MTRYLRRNSADRESDLRAGALAVVAGLGAAAVTFYLTRLFLRREVMEAANPPPPAGSHGRDHHSGPGASGPTASGPGAGDRIPES